MSSLAGTSFIGTDMSWTELKGIPGLIPRPKSTWKGLYLSGHHRSSRHLAAVTCTNCANMAFVPHFGSPID